MPPNRSDFSDIEAVVETYVNAMTLGDATAMRRVFAERACCIGHFGGGLEWDDLDGFIAAVEAEKAAPGTEVYWRMNGIDVVGDTAVVRVENDWAGMRFDDILTLLRHEGRWVIVSKLFHHRAA